MTLQENIAEYESNVRNWTVANLKLDGDFMKLCRDDEQFKEWVLDIKPAMANKKAPKMKFLGLGHSKVPVEPETPAIETEQVEKLSRTGQIIEDLKVYKKKQGFI